MLIRTILTLSLLTSLFFVEPLSAARRGRSQSNHRQLTSIKELYQFGRGAERDGVWQDAYLAYDKILSTDNGELLDEQSRLDVEIRLATVLTELGRVEQAVQLMKQVRSRELTQALAIQASLVELKLNHLTNRPMEAYQLLQQLDVLVDREEWRPADRALFRKVEEGADVYYEGTLSKAERLFDAAAHEEAKALYQQVLGYLDLGLYSGDIAALQAKVRYRLAQSAYLQDDFKEVIRVLSNQDLEAYESHPDLWPVFQNTTYLLGRSYRQLQRYHEAIEEYQRYLSFADLADLRYAEEVTWELGLCHFRLKDWLLAEQYFSEVPELKRRLYTLAQIYRGRVALQTRSFNKVEEVLSAVAILLREKDPLRFEVSYLRGEALYQQEEYLAAIDHLVAALPSQSPEKAPWHRSVLEKLSSSYLLLADDPNASLITQLHYFDEAEKVLKELITMEKAEEHRLELGRLYLAKIVRLKETAVYPLLEELLGEENAFSSVERDMEAQLLRAEAAPTFEDRQARYREMTSPAYSRSERYLDAWYYRGLNAYEEGRARRERGEGAIQLMEEAVESLAKVVEMTKESPTHWTGLALKYQAEALYTLGGKERLKEAIEICEQLMTREQAIWEAMVHPEEVLYLQGVMAAQLADEDPRYAEMAEGALRWIYVEYPTGHQVDDALNLLGRLQYKMERYADAEQSFIALGDRFPDSPHAGEAWYWAIQAAQKVGRPKKESDRYRRALFDLYPTTDYADEIYFQYYTYGEYLQGGDEAMAHLQAMPRRYPNSPYVVLAHYLLALDQKRDRMQSDHLVPQDLTAAVESFQEAVETYDFLLSKGMIPDRLLETLVKVRYQARLERSQTELEISEMSQGPRAEIYLDYAEKTFQEIIAALRDPKLPHRDLLIGESRYPRMIEEAEYGLIRVFRLRGKRELAHELMREMFQTYVEAGLTRGYILSRVWLEQGKLAMGENWPLAIDAFDHALDAGNGLLSDREQLELWMLSAKSNKMIGEYDSAMRLLSNVINQEGPDAFKTEAMVERALIYEAQDNPKMAFRQLKAAAQKKGIWAEKAKEKLEDYEGYY